MANNDKTRTRTTAKAYKKWRDQNSYNSETTLEEKPVIMEWNYWQLVENIFPYDKIVTKHDMLIPKRVFGSLEQASVVELQELASIKLEIGREYDMFTESTVKTKSLPAHYHLHCILLRDDLPE